MRRWGRATFVVAAVTGSACAAVLGLDDVRYSKPPPDGSADGPTDVAVDTAVEGAAASDTATDRTFVVGPLCDLDTEFSVLPVAELNGATEANQSARLSPDELTIYISRRAIGRTDNDIYVAKRDAATAQFSTPVELPLESEGGPNAPDASENYASVSDDGMRLVFARNEYLFLSQSDGGGFGPPRALQEWGGRGDDPIFFGNDIAYYTTTTGQIVRSRLGFSGNPVQLDMISAQRVYNGVPTSDEQGLYFAWRQPDAGNNDDVFLARRQDATAPFTGPPVRVPNINSTGDEVPLWLSPDRCRLYLINEGSHDILIASRAPRDAAAD